MSRETRTKDRSGLVGVVRDFLLVHSEMRAMFSRFRVGGLAFEDVQVLVGEGESSLLFRLKERCHALFRSGDHGAGGAALSEALFDLAVGSLFHESMKFRENFYQLEIYGPRVRSLRNEAGGEADELFREFEKILEGGAVRLLEALQESEALLAQTRKQLLVLLLHYRSDGLVNRCLIEHAMLVDEVFPEEGLEGLLGSMHGDAAHGYLLAARSYLASAFFAESLHALAEARKRSGERADIARLADFASGMQAFLAGSYGQSLSLIGRWAEAGVGVDERALAGLACDAIGHVGQLTTNLEDGERVRLTAQAGEVAACLKAGLAEEAGGAV